MYDFVKHCCIRISFLSTDMLYVQFLALVNKNESIMPTWPPWFLQFFLEGDHRQTEAGLTIMPQPIWVKTYLILHNICRQFKLSDFLYDKLLLVIIYGKASFYPFPISFPYVNTFLLTSRWYYLSCKQIQVRTPHLLASWFTKPMCDTMICCKFTRTTLFRLKL